MELPSDSDIVLMFFSSAYKMDTTSNYHPYTTSDDSVEFELKSLISDTTVKSLGPIDFSPLMIIMKLLFISPQQILRGESILASILILIISI